MQELLLLNEKLDLLIKKYSALQADNDRLKKTIDKQQKTIDGLSKKLADAEEKQLAQQVDGALKNDKERKAVRKQLDTVIGEIDKILNKLND